MKTKPTLFAAGVMLIPDCLDNAPLPATDASVVWEYKAIYRFHDEQVGQWSDVVNASVMG